MKAKYNFSAISAGEAAALYRGARDKQAQLGVLADLLCCGKEDVCELLRGYGCTVSEGAKPIRRRKGIAWTQEDDVLIRDMFDGGAACAQICAAVGRCEQSVRARLAHMGRYFRKRRTK